MAAAPTSSGDSPPPAQPEYGSISSMVASSASSAAAAVADFTRWAETFGTEKADAAKAALTSATTLATSSASEAASASSKAASSAYAAASDLTLVAKEELEWFKTEYSAHEQIVFGKIKGAFLLRKDQILGDSPEEGRSIQHELREISDIENQAVGLKGILDQLPRAHASEFRSKMSGLASQVKKEKRVLNAALTKIVNYGVPI
ncbi:Uncharacterized conserved protein UCP022280 [Zea mays]|uniref:Uncharacterized conserved protein UCP022280 n=1 Tax=Zea mays TaxID=4577 RepID=A0A1D6QV58_MAIZE|nr:Uncharacterized conserved protein UCP022280 [Zea mays]